MVLRPKCASPQAEQNPFPTAKTVANRDAATTIRCIDKREAPFDVQRRDLPVTVLTICIQDVVVALQLVQDDVQFSGARPNTG
jgi:hypothetical protein